MLFLARKPKAVELAALDQYPGPERFTCVGKELFIDYVQGVGTSKLTPVYLERHLDQAGTARNWNTLNKLIEATSQCLFMDRH